MAGAVRESRLVVAFDLAAIAPRLALVLLSCNGEPGADGGGGTTTPDVCDDPALTWEGFAAPYFRTWCTPCHAGDLVGDERHGAPSTVNFDTLAEAIALAPLVQLVAVDAVDMPPTNSIAPEDRARLGDWIACGTPGTEFPPPVLTFCDAPRSYAGDVTTSGTPAGACGDWDAVGGNLTVDSASPLLDCLCVVEGDLVVTTAAEVVMPKLVAVGGTLSAEGAADLTTIDAPYLESVSGHVLVTDCPDLASLNLPRLETITGGIVVARNPALATITSMQAVEFVGEGVQFIDLDALTELDVVPRVAEVGGRIQVIGNESLTSVWVGELLPTNTMGIWITDNPSLETILGLRLLVEAGQLSFVSLPELQVLPDLASLRDAAGLVLADTRSLTSMDGFDNLRHVSGALDISANTTLTDVQALLALQSVGGDLTVSDNPMLSTAMVDALIAAIGEENIGGAIDATGNGP